MFEPHAAISLYEKVAGGAFWSVAGTHVLGCNDMLRRCTESFVAQTLSCRNFYQIICIKLRPFAPHLS